MGIKVVGKQLTGAEIVEDVLMLLRILVRVAGSIILIDPMRIETLHLTLHLDIVLEQKPPQTPTMLHLHYPPRHPDEDAKKH